MNKLQTVYVPTKVEDELPDIMKSVVTVNSNGKYSVHQRVDAEVYKDDLETLTEFHDKYGFLNFGYTEVFVTDWLKPKQAFVFTPDQLKQLLSDYTEKIVVNTETKVEYEVYSDDGHDYRVVDENSIRQQLPLLLKELGYEDNSSKT